MSGEKWGYMQQYTSGLHFDPEHPTPDMLDIEDIALGLSRESRYAGQTSAFYSVAQHSVLVCDITPVAQQLWALLHDASEAYLKDLPWPVKRLVPEYKVMERRLMRVIAEKFNLRWPQPQEVHRSDLILLATERRDLQGYTGMHAGAYAPLSYHVAPWTSESARLYFLASFNRLTGG